MSKKRKIGLIMLCIVAVLIMTLSVSYAYFTSIISGTANQNVITSGTMRLEFTDGPAISLNDALPGDSVTKTFSVKNTGTLTTAYDLYFSEVCNGFADKTDLVYTIRHTSENGYELLTETEVPSTSSKIIDSQSIAPNETQTYEITIKFLNKDENQDDNQGTHFSSKLNINNSREPISCPVKVGNTLCSLNCDTDNDGVADTNLDNNNDVICDLNCDKNNDKTCDLNCDTTGDGQADTNIDDTGDGRCDRNCSPSIVYHIDNCTTKYAHTSNISDDGTKNGFNITYTSNPIIDTIKIDGASKLYVTFRYGWHAGYFSVYDGSVTPTSDNYDQSISGKLTGGYQNSDYYTEVNYEITGDTVQIYFDTGNNTSGPYGYYAIVSQCGPDKCYSKSNDYVLSNNDDLVNYGYTVDNKLSSRIFCNEGSPSLLSAKESPDFRHTAPYDTYEIKQDTLDITRSNVGSGSFFELDNTNNNEQYYICSDSYDFDEYLGRFSLINPQIIHVIKYSDLDMLVGKYCAPTTYRRSITIDEVLPRYYKYLEHLYKRNSFNITDDTLVSYNETYYSINATYDTDEKYNGMWAMEDDLGSSYYYRGAVEDNYVSFAGFCWRIIRINGDSSVRLIYQGTTCNLNSNEYAYFTTGKWSDVSGSEEDNMYSFYTWEKDKLRGYETDSLVKTVLESWYTSNLLAYDCMINDQIMCNDRTSYIDEAGTISGGGTGVDETFYGSYVRAFNFSPTLKCSTSEDRYTLLPGIGNGKLSQKIGLLTSDEVMLAGGKMYSYPTFYLNKGQGEGFWLSSPGFFDKRWGNNGNVSLLQFVYGGLNHQVIENNRGYRPVISLNNDVKVSSGDGSLDNPWIIDTSEVDNDTTGACATTTCTLSNCGSYGSCSATYTDEVGTQTRTCTRTCKSPNNQSITSVNTNYQDSTSCTGTETRWTSVGIYNYSTCRTNCPNECSNKGYSLWSCGSSLTTAPSSANLTSGKYCWCKK